MTAPMPMLEIPLAEVELEDHPFALPPSGDLGRLIASIREVGLLAPPWLRPRADGRRQVVTGLKRLLAVAQLGWERVPARTLPPGVPDSHCLLIALYDNAWSRWFTLPEQAAFAARLLDYWDEDTVVAKYLPYLGLPPSPAHLSRLLALHSLEPPFHRLAAAGRLALTAAAALMAWGPPDRAAALPFLEGLPLSQSRQEEFLEHVARLARRDGTTPAAILSRPELLQLLADTAHTPQERTAIMRRVLQRWVSPRLTAAQEAFQTAWRRLGGRHHPRVRLHPPPAFEGPDFLLEIKFRDAQELERLLEEIARLSRQDEFSGLTRLS